MVRIIGKTFFVERGYFTPFEKSLLDLYSVGGDYLNSLNAFVSLMFEGRLRRDPETKSGMVRARDGGQLCRLLKFYEYCYTKKQVLVI